MSQYKRLKTILHLQESTLGRRGGIFSIQILSRWRNTLSIIEDGYDEMTPTDSNSISPDCGMKSSDFVRRAENEDPIRRMRPMLLKRGWEPSFLNSLGCDLDESMVTQSLNDLFDLSSDAELVFDFFLWFERSSGSVHGIRSVCTMIHLSVLGYKCYIAVRLFHSLVKNNDGGEAWDDLVFGILSETHRGGKTLKIVYSMLFMTYLRENMIDSALKLMLRMKWLGFFPSLRACHALLKVLLESKKFNLACEVLSEIQSHGLPLNVWIISLFIREYCASGDLVSACKLLFEMWDNGAKPDIVCYTIVSDALCKRGLLKEATSLLYKLIQLGISLDSTSTTSLVNGYCKASRLMEAMNVMKACGCAPDTIVYSNFILKFCKDGCMTAAIELLNEMRDRGLRPDSYTYTSIIEGYTREGHVGQAFRYLCEMLKIGVKPTVVTMTVIIRSLSKIGDVQEAEYLFNMMKREGLKPDVVLYNTLIDGCSKEGNLHKAFGIFDIMKADDVTPDVATYNILIHGLANGVTASKTIFDEFVKGGFSPDKFTFTDIISKEKNVHEAFLVWHHMIENGIRPDGFTCSALLNVLCKASRMPEASSLFQKMLDAGVIPDLVLYNTLINGFCSVGDVHDAFRLLEMMAENGVIPDGVTCRVLVRGFEKNGVDNAVEVAAVKIQRIYMKYGIIFNETQYTSMFGWASEK
ncbi:hypothetical protein QJS10_CPB17g01634 [Acorus calamus]|uniref:Pentatricopeptide repeat-containing protein n=1 Tax=Acorus calamus TaxID=4465 RepID=A0AAV9CW32_ACOCL|nr:hypothetical protein QJS10_CPB17g01634 [Acorus calamus]